MAPIAFLAKSRSLVRPQNFKSISTFVHLHQEAQLAEPTPPPLPPNPASGSPRYNENWRSPASAASAGDGALIPTGYGFLNQSHASRIQLLSQSLDAESLNNQFASWTTSNRWDDMKQLFEFWIRSLDNNGKPNTPDVDLYNVYLRANLMIGASVGELLDLVAQMEEYAIFPNSASYNIVLKAMHRDRETLAAQKLIERMLQTGKEYTEALPDAESYDLVIDMLLSAGQIDAALKYIDLTLTSGYMFSRKAFELCVLKCINYRRLDTLVSIIEKCKKMDQNKSLCPPWRSCNLMAESAIKADNSQLTFYALEFMARRIARGEIDKPPVLYSTDEGLIVSALGTAGRTYNSTLVDGAWAILKRSLRKKKAPNPESYLAKIFAYANLGNLQKAFITLHELEKDYGNSNREDREELFSPFYSLNPLVVAFTKNGFATLDSVYYKLETLSQADQPYKSVAALNCVILGCANTWDVDRAYQTFHAIDSTFGLTANVHSYNALICSFGKLNKSDEAMKVFEHFVGTGVKPNATTYSLLIDALLVKRDPRAALSMVDEMIIAGYEPSKEMLKKIRRRCVREMDYECNDKVEALAKQFNIRMGREVRRDVLFQLQYTTTDYA
ncbi:pentatricopeptide repeat-containing protein at1g26460 mitochondrial [Phtheirospermum japonicum]|uniref:Pentatricopeptide repeat-containing protein at1g26460 mitochondrial n=1 Tax=Phtheirospermum japonicum TaxID=374723 RepID=A0A830BS83_9LAMI|nr:pentatricopeptide repeat-containing protein at1g26460 mitochondrial [Phtheirospermum japonicum]